MVSAKRRPNDSCSQVHIDIVQPAKYVFKIRELHAQHGEYASLLPIVIYIISRLTVLEAPWSVLVRTTFPFPIPIL